MREPFDECAADRQMDSDLARRRDQRGHRDDRHRERRDVDPVRARDAESEDHHARDGRARDGGGLEEDLVEGHRGRELSTFDEARRERTARRAVQSREGRAESGECI